MVAEFHCIFVEWTLRTKKIFQILEDILKSLLTLLGAAASVMAQPNTAKKDTMPTNNPSVSSYSKSARTEIGNAWDVQFFAAFNEYYLSQDGMELAVHSNSNNPFYPSTVESTGALVSLDTKYHPGFSAGFTLNTPFDQWVLTGDYLWARSHTSGSSSATSPDFLFAITTNVSFQDFLSSLQANWKVGMDLFNLDLSYPFYLGKKWMITPTFGIMSGWIRQYFHTSALQITTTDPAVQLSLKSNSWMIGPTAGFENCWLLGQGFSLFGNMSASVLYTRYTTLNFKNRNTATSADWKIVASLDGWNAVHPYLDAGMGVKWGSFFHCNKYYVEFSAAYNFMTFFAQNQMMPLVQNTNTISSYAPGNLYMHGVSIEGSFLF